MPTVYDDERIFDGIRAGASGYLLKKTRLARLLEVHSKTEAVARRCATGSSEAGLAVSPQAASLAGS
jgi:DNA-binding NarL/FixJ family response regulator